MKFTQMVMENFVDFEQVIKQADDPEEGEAEEYHCQDFCSTDGDSNGFISEYELREVRDSLGTVIDNDELH